MTQYRNNNQQNIEAASDKLATQAPVRSSATSNADSGRSARGASNADTSRPIRESDRRSTRVASIALLASLALIFSYVEVLIPFNFGIPGVKLGIANIVVVIALYRYSARHAGAVNFVRVMIAGLLFTGVFGAIYSLAGAIVSLVGMAGLKKSGFFSITGVSMAGGVLHNLGQLIVAAILIEDTRMFLYFPVLLFSGLITGILIGIVAQLVVDRLPHTV